MIYATKSQNEVSTKVVDFSYKLNVNEAFASTAITGISPTIVDVSNGQDIYDSITTSYSSIDTATNKVKVLIGRGGVIGNTYIIKCVLATADGNTLEENIELRVT